MRKNYPVFSKEFNDIFQDLYYKLTYLLGYDDSNGNTTYIGKLDVYESDINTKINTVVTILNDDSVTYDKYTLINKAILINKLKGL